MFLQRLFTFAWITLSLFIGFYGLLLLLLILRLGDPPKMLWALDATTVAVVVWAVFSLTLGLMRRTRRRRA